MKGRKSRFMRQILGAGLLVFLLTFSSPAQDEDPNPDSPTPILLSSGGDSSRAVAVMSDSYERTNSTRTKSIIFNQNSTITLFVSNLDLMPDEGANAFRINVEDTNGREYRFPVLVVSPVKDQAGVYALTVRLTDELGFWARTKFRSDVLVSVAWRGLTSNRARLAIGKSGGTFKNEIAPTAKTDKTQNLLDPNFVGYYFSTDRTRLLEQATFGPNVTFDQKIRRLGIRTWLNGQFEAPYPTNPYPNLALMPTNVSTDCQNNIPANCIRDFYTQFLFQNWFYKEAFYGEAQLRHRIAWTLSQLWVVSGVDTQQASWMIAYHQKLAQNAFGNYRDLMSDMSLNPAMGNYLDMARSTKNSPNENYAREILQLFSVGLFMLNQDGTLQLDGSGKPIPTYDQNTVNNFTKVFTGWTLCNTGCPNSTLGAPNYKDPMVLSQTNHDVTAKSLLAYPGAVNQNIAANTNGTTEMTQALDNIFNHPNVAPFVSRILIQHLVTSDPTPAYVGRVAAVFNNNGGNVRGDLKAVVRAILIDPEARGNVKTDPKYGKLREPVQLATNLYRQFNVVAADGASQSDGWINQTVSPMGQSAFLSPTVFNYYTPDYTVPGTALNGPEFGILTTGTAVARANFVNNVVFSRVTVGTGTGIDLSEMQALATADASGNQLLDALNTKLMHGTMSAQMKNTILTAVQAVAATDPLTRARTAVYLVASSSQYQVQR